MKALALILLACTVLGASRAVADRPACAAAVEQHMGAGGRGYVATVLRSARAYARPGGAVVHRFDRVSVNGGPSVFAVVGRLVDSACRARWYHVQVPLRPNGATAYVHPYAVRLSSVRTRIVVDVARRRLTFLRRGRVVLRTAVAVGTAATPTPRGRFYVKEALLTVNPRGAFGPGALGLSAYSPVLTGWAQGGPIGIHGTDEPRSIGHAASNGCIRVPNAVAKRLLALVPLGTPVLVR